MRAVVWSDYLCPWCYLGHDRTQLMRDLGVEVTPRPFELHPGIPLAGLSVRPGNRLSAVFEQVSVECETLGLPFRFPERVPNSRRALETAELVVSAGVPIDVVLERRNNGEGGRVVDDSMAEAREHGVTSTPTWLVDGELMIGGAQPRETVERWIIELQAQTEPSDAADHAGRI